MVYEAYGTRSTGTSELGLPNLEAGLNGSQFPCPASYWWTLVDIAHWLRTAVQHHPPAAASHSDADHRGFCGSGTQGWLGWALGSRSSRGHQQGGGQAGSIRRLDWGGGLCFLLTPSARRQFGAGCLQGALEPPRRAIPSTACVFSDTATGFSQGEKRGVGCRSRT